jgi:hypothetical protein
MAPWMSTKQNLIQFLKNKLNKDDNWTLIIICFLCQISSKKSKEKEHQDEIKECLFVLLAVVFLNAAIDHFDCLVPTACTKHSRDTAAPTTAHRK